MDTFFADFHGGAYNLSSTYSFLNFFDSGDSPRCALSPESNLYVEKMHSLGALGPPNFFLVLKILNLYRIPCAIKIFQKKNLAHWNKNLKMFSTCQNIVVQISFFIFANGRQIVYLSHFVISYGFFVFYDGFQWTYICWYFSTQAKRTEYLNICLLWLYSLMLKYNFWKLPIWIYYPYIIYVQYVEGTIVSYF